MKNHYLILLSAFDVKTKKKVKSSYSFYGTVEQAEKETQGIRDYWKRALTVKDLKIELLRVDSMTHIKTYK